MRIFKMFFALFAITALMTACQKESVSTEELNVKDPSEQYLAKFQQDYENYLVEHQEITIEYMTLEELNESYIKYGLEPVTLEQLGVTQEEYEEAQARINDSNYAKERCSNSTIAGLYGDVNNSGALTSYDNFLANQYFTQNDNNGGPNLRLVTSSTPAAYQDFALLSYFHTGNYPNDVDEYDTYIADRAILGIISCNL